MLKIVPRGKKGLLQIVGKMRGHRVHHSTGTTSWGHAEAERIKIEQRILDEAVYGKRATAIFAEAVEVYLDSGGSPRFVAPLNEHFGRWLMSSVSQVELMKFAKLQHPGATAETVNRQVFTPMIAIWHAAHEAGLCGPHEFHRPKVPERSPVAFARDDDIAKLLPTCSARLRAAVLLISFTGARASECCRLEDDDVDWDRRSVLLRKTKNGKPRVVVLPDIAYKALLPLKGTKGPLFGLKSRYSLNQALRRACKRAGLPVMTSHKIGRHAFAARHLRRGRTLKEVQEAGGWSAKSLPLLASVYGHLEKSAVDQMVREADRELTQILRKSSPRAPKTLENTGRKAA